MIIKPIYKGNKLVWNDISQFDSLLVPVPIRKARFNIVGQANTSVGLVANNSLIFNITTLNDICPRYITVWYINNSSLTATIVEYGGCFGDMKLKDQTKNAIKESVKPTISSTGYITWSGDLKAGTLLRVPAGITKAIFKSDPVSVDSSIGSIAHSVNNMYETLIPVVDGKVPLYYELYSDCSTVFCHPQEFGGIPSEDYHFPQDLVNPEDAV